MEDFKKSSKIKQIETAYRIRELREERGYTQEMMAELCHTSYDQYRKMETTGSMSINVLRGVKEATGVSFDYLLDGQQDTLDAIRCGIRGLTREQRTELFLMQMQDLISVEITKEKIARIWEQEIAAENATQYGESSEEE